MPFDNPADLKPSLTMLSHVLRHPEEWPPGFKWDYQSCETCAIGLACQLWPSAIKLPGYCRITDFCGGIFFKNVASRMAHLFTIPQEIAEDIFIDLWEMVDGPITPNHVADAIDAYLVRHP